jgi:hypothetical protein
MSRITGWDIKESALRLLGGWGFAADGMAEGLFYDRITVRQQEIFMFVNQLDREYFGAVSYAPVVANRVVLDDLPDGHLIETLDVIRVAVAEPGSSRVWGERVRVVRADDTRELSPRVTLRNRVLMGVGDDLAGVRSLSLYYSLAPTPMALDGSTQIDLPDSFADLLALDLAKFTLNRDLETAQSPAMAYFVAEEERRLTILSAHVAASYRSLEARLG